MYLIRLFFIQILFLNNLRSPDHFFSDFTLLCCLWFVSRFVHLLAIF